MYLSFETATLQKDEGNLRSSRNERKIQENHFVDTTDTLYMLGVGKCRSALMCVLNYDKTSFVHLLLLLSKTRYSESVVFGTTRLFSMRKPTRLILFLVPFLGPGPHLPSFFHLDLLMFFFAYSVCLSFRFSHLVLCQRAFLFFQPLVHLSCDHGKLLRETLDIINLVREACEACSEYLY